ncbi:MAG: hypothetical protein ACOYMZ_02275 [Minisyncoccia bacterium]
MTDYSIGLAIVFIAFSGFMGYIWGNSKRGSLVKYTNELPNGFLRVISIDKVSSVLEEIDVNRKRFLVSTEVFGGKPIRPTDIVRKIKSDKERKELGIKVLGYPPLVKEEVL